MSENNSYWKLPKLLFSPKYQEVSLTAKLAYCFMLERHHISVDNKWLDSDGVVYIYFSIKTLAEILSVSSSTVVRALRELEEFSLIKRKKQGFGRPDKIKVSPLEMPKTQKDSIATYDIREIDELFNAPLQME